MRYPPVIFSFSLHRIAATMSTPYPFRNHRGGGRRRYSDYPPAAVSGDSHFQSVHNANTSLIPNNNNNGGLRFQPNRPRPIRFDRRSNQPPVRGRPPDFRIWEYAKHPPPPYSERFVVLSYNILADYLANGHRNLYYHIPHKFMSWNWRKGNVLFELGLWSPDILCFQEVDRFSDLEEELRHRGYSGIWKMRTGKPTDGCAIFWRTSRFKLVYEECIEFNKLGMRDNVAQVCVLESLFENHTNKKLDSSSSYCSSNGRKRVVVCNIHVLYNPRRGEIKLGQIRVLLERAQAVSKKWDDAAVVLCGDFNCTPKSPLYNFISEQKIDISEIERDKVSGQASAQLHPPPQQYVHQARGQVSGNTTSTTMSQNFSLENQQASESNMGNLPTAKHLSQLPLQPPVNESMRDVLDKVCNDSLNSNLTSTSPEISHHVDDVSKEDACSQISVSVDLLKDDGDSCHADKSLADNRPAQSSVQFASESSVEKTILTTEQDSINYNDETIFPSVDDSNKEIVEDTHYSNASASSCQFDSIEVHNRAAASDVPSHVIDTKSKHSTSFTYGTSEPKTPLSFKNDIDDKLSGLSLGEIDSPVEDSENIVEDAEKFMSELNDDGDGFPSNLNNTIIEDETSSPELEAVDASTMSYDPSAWTSMEIATATGNSNNTALEHSLKLKSTYTEVVDRSGTRDSNGEPLLTSYNSCFMGTVDYIWRSEGLHTVKVLAPIPKDAMQQTGGFPTKKWGSDHIALVTELAFTK